MKKGDIILLHILDKITNSSIELIKKLIAQKILPKSFLSKLPPNITSNKFFEKNKNVPKQR